MTKEVKIFIIGIAVMFLIMLLIGGVYFAFFAPGPNSSENRTRQVTGTDGSKVAVRDFTPDIQMQTESSQVIKTSDQFDLLYFPQDQAFLITLESLPLKTARGEGEKALLENLNIPESEACNLKIEVKVPDEIDPNLSGINLGLSFCPNSTQLQ